MSDDNHSNRPGSLVTRPISATLAQVLPADARRRSIVFGTSAVGVIYVGTTQDTADTKGLLLPASGAPVKLCCCDLGSLVTREWWAVCPAGAAFMTVIETLAAADEV